MTSLANRPAMTGVLSTTEELNDQTRLLLRLLRQWLTGLSNNDTGVWQQAWNDLCGRMGEANARRVLVGVERFIKVINRQAVRSVMFRPIPCGFVGMDEGVMLLLLRKAGSGDSMGAMEPAAGLVHSEAARDLSEAALQLHTAFANGTGEAGNDTFLAGGWLSRERPAASTTIH